MPKTKILIIDGNLISRENLRIALESLDDIDLLSAAPNGKIGISKIAHNPPDIVIFGANIEDITAPEFVRQMLKRYPELDLLVAVIQDNIREAEIAVAGMEAGAFDFILLPEKNCQASEISRVQLGILQKIRCHSIKRYSRIARQLSRKTTFQAEPSTGDGGFPEDKAPEMRLERFLKKSVNGLPKKVEAILIGVSTGGPEALAKLLPEIPATVSAPIVIVQHMPALFTQSLAESLNGKSRISIKEAVDGDKLQAGHAYLARGGSHLLVERIGDGLFELRMGDGPPENGCKPSVDVLFRSAAKAQSQRMIAIILTGMGSDGTKGLAALKEKNVVVLAQDEESSVVWGMPGSAVKQGCVDEVLPLDKLPVRLLELLSMS